MDVCLNLPNATNYWTNRYGRTKKWQNIPTGEQMAAIEDAMFILDTYNYVGTKAEPNQVHQWPRVLSTGVDIPTPVQYAVYEQAYTLLMEGYTLDITSTTIGDFKQVKETRLRDDMLTSAKARMYLKPYIRRTFDV